MKKATSRILFLLAALTMALSLGACGKEPQPEAPQNTDGTASVTDVNSGQFTDEPEPVGFEPYIPDSYYDEELGGAPAPLWYEPVTVVYSEEEAARFDNIIAVDDGSGEECNLIWWNSDVTDVLIVPVTMLEDGTWAAGVSDYHWDSVNMGTAISLTMMVPEGMPSHAVRACSYGEYRFWAIGYNGRIGGISFMEIEVSEAG